MELKCYFGVFKNYAGGGFPQPVAFYTENSLSKKINQNSKYRIGKNIDSRLIKESALEIKSKAGLTKKK